jgi:hypothetical protein
MKKTDAWFVGTIRKRGESRLAVEVPQEEVKNFSPGTTVIVRRLEPTSVAK